MSSFLRILFFLFLFSIQISAFQTSLCAPGRLEVGGVELVERNRGRILLTVRCGLECQDCHKHLKEFSLMVESISDLSVSVLVPQDENPSAVRHSQLEFPRLQFLHDSTGRTVGWPEGQQILFDRCGRVSKIIRLRDGDPPYLEALEAVRIAVSHAQCGWCQYDTRATRDLSRRQFDAYLRSEKRSSREERRDTSHQQQQRADYSQRQADYRRPQQPQPHYTQQQPQQPQQQQPQFTQPQHKQPQQNHHHQQQPPQYQQFTQPHYNYEHVPSQQRSYSYNSQSPQQGQSSQNGQYNQAYQQQPQFTQPQQQYVQDQRSYQQAQRGGYEQGQGRENSFQYRNQQLQPEGNQAQRRDNYEERNHGLGIITTTPSPTAAMKKKLHYSEDSDYGDYDEDPAASSHPTTARTETQIPRPSSPNPWWPTAPPAPATMDYRLLMGADVPCAAFTDDICYMQQEKVGQGGQMPKCCSKGIYLTDLCVPGKCSNSTSQLCCLQKFLQAKYACCSDESQSDDTSTTNKFSECCYSKFVTKDECCSPERADDYWSSVHELCYPNTKVDLSTVKLEVRFAEGIRVIDLGENRIWDHTCKFGGNRMQLAFFP